VAPVVGPGIGEHGIAMGAAPGGAGSGRMTGDGIHFRGLEKGRGPSFVLRLPLLPSERLPALLRVA